MMNGASRRPGDRRAEHDAAARLALYDLACPFRFCEGGAVPLLSLPT
jgi:hypothetical protein